MLTELDLIMDQGIKEERKWTRRPPPKRLRSSSPRLRLFAQSLARLLEGGVPLIRSLEILERESKDQSFKLLLSQIKDWIREGESLSEAMAKEPRATPEYFTQMLEAGELSGTLPQVLKLLSDHLTKEEERKRKIIEAIAYPSLVFILGLTNFFILLQFVIPKITQVYEDFGGKLPILTQAIISLSHLVIPLAVLIVLTFGFLVYGFRNKNDLFLKLLTKLPLIGSLIQQSFLSQFSSLFSLLLKSGIPVLKALESVSNTFPSQSLRNDFEGIKAQISEGISLTQALNGLSWVTDTSKALIASGEESGKLPEAFDSIQKETAAEFESHIHFLLKILEPLLIVTVGIAIGFIVVGALLPILEMSELIQ